jgi:hypothetical protein
MANARHRGQVLGDGGRGSASAARGAGRFMPYGILRAVRSYLGMGGDDRAGDTGGYAQHLAAALGGGAGVAVHGWHSRHHNPHHQLPGGANVPLEFRELGPADYETLLEFDERDKLRAHPPPFTLSHNLAVAQYRGGVGDVRLFFSAVFFLY